MSDLLDVKSALRSIAPASRSEVDVNAILRRGAHLRARRRVGRALVFAALPLVVATIALTAVDSKKSTSVDAGPQATSPDLEHQPAEERMPSSYDGAVSGRLTPHEASSSEASSIGGKAPAGGVPVVPRGSQTEDRQPLITDAADDTAADQWALPGASRDPEPMLDLREGDIALDGESLSFSIAVTDLDEGSPPGSDGASYRFGFDYHAGDSVTRLLGVLMERVDSAEQIRLVTDNGSWDCAGCAVKFDADGDVITGTVPKRTLEQFATQFGAQAGDAELRALRLQSGWVHTMEGLTTAGANADDASSDKSFSVPART